MNLVLMFEILPLYLIITFRPILTALKPTLKSRFIDKNEFVDNFQEPLSKRCANFNLEYRSKFESSENYAYSMVV